VKYLMFALFCVFAIPQLRAKNLSVVEQNLVKAVDSENEAALSLLEKVVNINSGTLNVSGVKKVGSIFEKEFQKLGFKTRWVTFPKKIKRAGHLFAEIDGGKGKKTLLIGHLDTVFDRNSPFQKFKREGDIAYGPGISDMKGGLVTILYALKALKKVGVLRDRRIIVAFMGDEESLGGEAVSVRKDLVEAAKKSDAALGFEYAVGSINKATIARRGFTYWELEVQGKQGHSSLIFSKEAGVGAIFGLSDILTRFYQELHRQPHLTFNPGMILGGTEIEIRRPKNLVSGKANVISQKAMSTGDLRTLSDAQRSKVKKQMSKIAANSLPGTKASIVFKDIYPPMSPKRGNKKLLGILSQVNQDLGYGPVHALDPGKRGAADTSFVAPHVSTLDGLGLLGNGAHSSNENVNLKALSQIKRRSAIFIYRLTKD